MIIEAPGQVEESSEYLRRVLKAYRGTTLISEEKEHKISEKVMKVAHERKKKCDIGGMWRGEGVSEELQKRGGER